MPVAVRFLAYVMLIMAVGSVVCATFSRLDSYDDQALLWLLYSALLTTCGVALVLATDLDVSSNTDREQALITCGILTLFLPMIAAVPFYLYGNTLLISWFESVSGLTTTGASALARPSLLPDALVAWRVMLEWLGGWLFLVFALGIQPVLNLAGTAFTLDYLPHGEATTYFAKVMRVGRTIGRLYVSITGMAVLLLMLAGLPAGLAVPFSMIGVSTGGYIPSEQGLSLYIGGLPMIAVLVLLTLGCLNFSLHYAAVRGDVSVYWRDRETRSLFRLLALGVLAVFTISLLTGAIQGDILRLRDVFFLALSAVSTTGISPLGTQTAPLSIGILLLCLTVAGGMAGSTTGGIKVLRAQLIDRFVNAELIRVSNPHRLNPVSFDRRIIKAPDMLGVWALVLVIAVTIAVGSLFLSALQMPFLTAIAVSVSSATNAGPLPELMDARFAGYGALSPGMMMTCAVLMLLGKLEFLVLLSFIFIKFFKR